jgi:hypothetical protein
MRRPILSTTAAAAAVVLAGVGLSARAAGELDFHLVEQSVKVDNDAKTATFRLSFDREPRFFQPHDGGGGGDQPDAFQIEVDADHVQFDRPIQFEDIDAVVRGAEIATSDGAGIPVRYREPGAGGDGGGDDDINAGGWGAVRAVVPFDIDGATLTFTAPLESLGEDDGRFRYRVFTTEQGATTSEVNAAIIPLPAAAWGGMMLFGAAGTALKLRKRRR